LLDTIDPDELDEWHFRDSCVSPIPDTWLQTGVIAAAIANRGFRPSKKWLSAEDVFPFLKTEPRKQSQAQIKSVLSRLVGK
jgi:hypothetical protein